MEEINVLKQQNNDLIYKNRLLKEKIINLRGINKIT